MEVNNVAIKIVGSYFNNAIIIDDDMEIKNINEDSSEKIDLKDEDLDMEDLDLENIEFDSSEKFPADILELSHKPFEVFKSFLENGIVTVPFQYDRNKNTSENVEKIEKILKNSKLLIIDWEMETNAGILEKGNATKNIIQEFLKSDSGIKCVVIYTKERLEEVIDSIEKDYKIIDRDAKFFQNKDDNNKCSLFGFIMNKKISPSEIINKIAEILIEDKSTTLHFMECANKLENNLHTTLQKFDAPFEKVLLSQIFTSGTLNKDISKFINNTFLSDLIHEYSIDNENHFLFERKKERIKKIISKKIDINETVNSDIINDIIKILAIDKEKTAKKFIEKQFTDIEFYKKLFKILQKDSLNSFESFINEINILLKSLSIEESKREKAASIIVLFILCLEDYINEIKEEKVNKRFKDSYYKETVKFTRIMKYYAKDDQIKTGTILRDTTSNVFYFCITPVCDIARLGNVEDKYKFIIGNQNPKFTENKLKNINAKEHYTALPDINDQSLIFVQWKFYDINTIEKAEIDNLLKDEKIEIMGTIKIEYAQNIINRYIAYQSRAGVQEMFYKESSYISNFFNIIDTP